MQAAAKGQTAAPSQSPPSIVSGDALPLPDDSGSAAVGPAHSEVEAGKPSEVSEGASASVQGLSKSQKKKQREKLKAAKVIAAMHCQESCNHVFPVDLQGCMWVLHMSICMLRLE